MKLLEPFSSPALSLKNRVVMAPMTRNRASADHVPTPLMADYYGQRAGAGLIVTEGTSPSPNGLGYARIPGLFNDEQVKAWRPVTEAVHQRGAKIFVQLMHTGRVGHTANLPAGAEVLGPTSTTLPGEMYTDTQGMQAHTTPRAMTEDDIEHAIAEHVASARLALEAGFDGVELHAANGYLLEQFLNANVNTRDDRWGGSAGHRNRLALEVTRRVAEAIGAHRVGIRLSPFGAFNATGAYDGVEAQYVELARALAELKIGYLHLVDHSSMGAPEVPAAFKAQLRQAFGGTLIVSGGFARDSAEQALAEGRGELVAFARPWLANPDLVERLRRDLPLNSPDFSTFYTPGPKGYTDYPVAA
jgi:N-ethylmaleimide reductase